MKKLKYTEEQIAFALRQAESGVAAAEVCRKMGISEATFYAWKKKYGGLGVSELRRLLQLEEAVRLNPLSELCGKNMGSLQPQNEKEWANISSTL